MSLGFRTGVAALAFAPLLVLACGAGDGGVERKSLSGSGAGSGTGAGATGSGSGSGSGSGVGGSISFAGTTGDPDAGGCQTFDIHFEPQIPTVYLVVDRSGSMFVPVNNVTPWAALRGGALDVISTLEAEVRFGFAAYAAWPGAPLGVACPTVPTSNVDLQLTPPDMNNHAAISALYSGLEQPAASNIDTGSTYALNAVAEELWNDPTPGGKYILFVTDGEPDFCDNPGQECPIDSVTATLQRFAQGMDRTGAARGPISTIVLGVATSVTQIADQALTSFANAGAGQPVGPLTINGTQTLTSLNIYERCNPVPGWLAEYTASGKTMEALATYSPAAGTATVFKPDPTDQAAISDKIREALAGVKACTFDISEGNIEIDWTRADLGSVAGVQINGAAVPYDPANGWTMSSSTVVELTGTACEQWRAPGESSIHFDFPCDVVVVVK
jgi:hypothetical protein